MPLNTSRIPRLIKIAVGIFVVADVVCLAFEFYPPSRLATLVALGRNHGCPLSKAVHSDDEARLQLEIRDRLFSSFKKAESAADGSVLWNTAKGPYWIPEGCERTLAHNLAEQERRIYGAGSVNVKPGDTVLDCGANIGVFTRVALKAGAKLVVAIEPAPENVACLRRNFAREIEAGRVIVCPKGVWDKDDVLTLRIHPHNSARDSFVVNWKDSHEGVKVPLTTVDELVADLHLERVDFIKMDIEGAEKRALQGARATLNKYKPQLAVATEHLVDDGDQIPVVMRNLAPSYKVECGPCDDLVSYLTPDVLYFRAVE